MSPKKIRHVKSHGLIINARWKGLPPAKHKKIYIWLTQVSCCTEPKYYVDERIKTAIVTFPGEFDVMLLFRRVDLVYLSVDVVYDIIFPSLVNDRP